MRYIYTVNQKLQIVSPSAFLSMMQKNPISHVMPVKIYRHDPKDTMFQHGEHIATIIQRDGVIGITFEPNY